MPIEFDTFSDDYKGGSPLLPEGEYKVLVVAVDHNVKVKGVTEGLKLKLEVIDGPYRGKYINEYLNIFNDNFKAQGMGRTAWRGLVDSVGGWSKENAPKEYHDVVGKTAVAKVYIAKPQQGREQYGEQNKVKDFLPKVSPTVSGSTPGASNPPPAKGNKPDWA